MSKVSRSALTKMQIVRAACGLFLEHGYSDTTAKMISATLNMSPGNLTFHFPTKEHLLAELTDFTCRYQWELMKEEVDGGNSSVTAYCLELMTMAAMCEDDTIVKDLYLSAYRSSYSMDMIRKNDAARAQKVFKEFRPNWTEQQFAEAAVLTAGIKYSTLMTTGEDVPLEMRIGGALELILMFYGLSADLRRTEIERVLAMDYHDIGRRVVKNFKEFVTQANEQALLDLLDN